MRLLRQYSQELQEPRAFLPLCWRAEWAAAMHRPCMGSLAVLVSLLLWFTSTQVSDDVGI